MVCIRQSVVAVAMGVVVLGCGAEKPSPAVGADAAATAEAGTAGACSTERGVKVGVTFVHICAPLAPDAVWIAATPLPCSAGEHETLECPLTTSLLVAPAVPLAGLSPASALRTDAVSAYRTCQMRFGGRLPTPAERDELRRLQGMTAVVATAEADGRVRFDEVDEWTASGDCGNPSRPGPDCRFERSPGTPAPPVEWSALRRCVAEPARAAGDAAAVAIGERCPADGPCLVRSPWFPRADAIPLAHALSCAAPAAATPHPERRPDVAAFRCVLPRGALTPSP